MQKTVVEDNRYDGLDKVDRGKVGLHVSILQKICTLSSISLGGWGFLSWKPSKFRKFLANLYMLTNFHWDSQKKLKRANSKKLGFSTPPYFLRKF